MATMYLQRIGVSVREFDPMDLDAVMLIETAAFDEPILQCDLVETLRDWNVQCLVLERGSAMLGYVLYEEKKQSLLIQRIAVSYPLCGFGTVLVGDVKRRCFASGRQRVESLVPETDVVSQLFFSKSGFRAVGIEAGEPVRYLFRHQR